VKGVINGRLSATTGETIISVRRISTAAIAAAGLSMAGLGAFAAVPASAATTTQACKTIDHVTWRTVKHVTYKRVHGKRVKVVRHVRVEVVSKTTTCTVTGATGAAGSTGATGATGAMGSTGATGAGAVVPALTSRQQVQAWADASGNADWYLVAVATSQLEVDEGGNPVTCDAADQCETQSYDLPSAALQSSIKVDASALVAHAQAALADPPPGDLTASWDAVMTDQVAYGQQIVSDPASWFTYTFSQPDVNTLTAAAVLDDLPGIYLSGISAPTPGVPTPTAASCTTVSITIPGDAYAGASSVVYCPAVNPVSTWASTSGVEDYYTISDDLQYAAADITNGITGNYAQDGAGLTRDASGLYLDTSPSVITEVGGPGQGTYEVGLQSLPPGSAGAVALWKTGMQDYVTAGQDLSAGNVAGFYVEIAAASAAITASGIDI
jgi:hypothetical protein